MTDKRTCLYEQHVALGAKMVSFGGFEMPLQYTDILSEHMAVRHACGVFDVSHMGEVHITGAGAHSFVQHIFTANVEISAPAGKIFYGMMTRPCGGVVDDLLVYKVADQDYLLVVNAANIEKDFDWMTQQAAKLKEAQGWDIILENLSDQYGQLAVQGPEAVTVVETRLGLRCADLSFYTFESLQATAGDVQEEIIVSRTGYTGEDGFELYGSPAYIRAAWAALTDCKGQGSAAKPCGLGCRDTLRFEVGLPLYGDELSDEITPLEAGLGMFVSLDKGDFIGREALLKQKAEGLSRRIVGLELEGKAIARHGYEVVDPESEQVVGHVTTGYLSPSTGRSVCMAMVSAPCNKLETPLQVRIHRKLHPATVCKKRFYQKNYHKG